MLVKALDEGVGKLGLDFLDLHLPYWPARYRGAKMRSQ